MRVLVTGGAGYIGSHAARELARCGHEVRIYDNLSTGYRQLAEGFELIVGDIADDTTLRPALRGIDAVMHFAAHAYVGESVQDPRKYFRNNVLAAMNLLNATLDSGIKNFVFSSTCAVYGVPPEVPIAEQMPREPVNPYGASKLFFERALKAYSDAYGFHFAALRYFNAAGADEAGGIGEMHDPETHLIPCILETAAGVREHVSIFGVDYPTPDGSCIRDYVHVNDLANAHVLALDFISRANESLTVNLGTGEGYSVKQVLAATEKLTGRTVPRRICPRRPGDPPALVADPSRARTLLSWSAKRSLPQILETAWQWMQQREQFMGIKTRDHASSQGSAV
jgi:UDP-glucose-4-epimerase GalE